MEVPDLHIRPAAADDLEAINHIYNREIESGVATWDYEPWTIERRREWFTEHGPLTPVLVAEADGVIAGFAYASFMSAKRGWRFTREDTIYIDERYRGRGVGNLLLPTLLDALREVGVRLVVASITSSNLASLRLHEKFGFQAVGALRNAGYKFGQWMDTTYMQVDLGEPASERPAWH